MHCQLYQQAKRSSLNQTHVLKSKEVAIIYCCGGNPLKLSCHYFKANTTEICKRRKSKEKRRRCMKEWKSKGGRFTWILCLKQCQRFDKPRNPYLGQGFKWENVQRGTEEGAIPTEDKKN